MADYFDTGFCVRQASWHGKETLVQDYPEDWAAARTLAGLDWEPTYRDTFVEDVLPVDAELPEGTVVLGITETGDQLVHVPQGGHQAIIRSDTRETLAIPRKSWKLISHEQMGEMLEAYTAAWRTAGATVKFETAGSVRGGKQVWALVRLDEPYRIPGDSSDTYPFATLLNAHDGSASCRMMPTQVRVVCWNTWKAAEYDASSKGLGVVLRHSGDIDNHVETAKATLSEMRDEAKAWQLRATDLAGYNYDDEGLRHFVDEFIPIPENASANTREKRAEKQAIFRGLLASRSNADLPDTAYKLVQAAGEYLDHARPYRSADTYLARTMLSAEPIKAGVMDLAREVCTA